jgi:hypothetical protein
MSRALRWVSPLLEGFGDMLFLENILNGMIRGYNNKVMNIRVFKVNKDVEQLKQNGGSSKIEAGGWRREQERRGEEKRRRKGEKDVYFIGEILG